MGDQPNSPGPLSIVGYFSAASGLGQGARLLYSAYKELGIDVRAIDVTPEIIPHLAQSEASFDVDPGSGSMVFHVNPPEVLNALDCFQPKTLINRRRIAMWLWELQAAPQSWGKYVKYFHNIWSPSKFSATAIDSLGCDVSHVGYAINPSHFDHERSPVPKDNAVFTGLVVADTQSSLERKNPKMAIALFQKTFSGINNARLIVKLSNTAGRVSGLQAIKDQIRSDNRIILMDNIVW